MWRIEDYRRAAPISTEQIWAEAQNAFAQTRQIHERLLAIHERARRAAATAQCVRYVSRRLREARRIGQIVQ